MTTATIRNHVRAELEHRNHSSQKGRAMNQLVGMTAKSVIVVSGIALASVLGACGQAPQEVAALDTKPAQTGSELTAQAVNNVCMVGCAQNSIVAAIKAAAPGSTISIGAGVYHEKLILTKNITLQGAGAQQTILDGSSAIRVLEVQKGVVAVIKGVTIRKGNVKNAMGSGVLNNGTLTLNESIITANESRDQKGAGISNAGHLTLLRSTISENTGIRSGGGIYNTGFLGCFYSTISNNSAVLGSAIANENGNATFVNCTINEPNGNAITNDGAHAGIVFQNSIIVGRSGNANGAACLKSPESTFASLGYNLSNDATCNLTATMDQANSQRIFLGVLQMNAPGRTPTHALMTGSAALDAGNCGGTTAEPDQRGVARPQNGICDIGAYEQRPPVAVADSFRTAKGQVLTVAAPGLLSNDLSPEGLRLIFATARGAAHGVLNYGNDGSFRYTPNAGFTGSDTFTYQVTDGSLYSNFATVTVTVDNINHAPVAVGETYSTVMNTPLTVNAARGILANDSDPDGDPISFFAISTFGQGGRLAPNRDGSFTFTPNTGFVGTVDFAYQLNDGKLNSNSTHVSFQVTAPAPGSVGVIVYQEMNFNGTWDYFEQILSGWTVTAKNNQTGQTQTLLSGASLVPARFANLMPGSYTICQTTKPGWTSVSGDSSAGCYTRNVISGQTMMLWFGNANQ
jgi:Bacterial Ig domain